MMFKTLFITLALAAVGAHAGAANFTGCDVTEFGLVRLGSGTRTYFSLAIAENQRD